MSGYLQRLFDGAVTVAAPQPAQWSRSPLVAADQRLGVPGFADNFGFIGAGSSGAEGLAGVEAMPTGFSSGLAATAPLPRTAARDAAPARVPRPAVEEAQVLRARDGDVTDEDVTDGDVRRGDVAVRATQAAPAERSAQQGVAASRAAPRVDGRVPGANGMKPPLDAAPQSAARGETQKHFEGEPPTFAARPRVEAASWEAALPPQVRQDGGQDGGQAGREGPELQAAAPDVRAPSQPAPDVPALPPTQPALRAPPEPLLPPESDWTAVEGRIAREVARQMTKAAARPGGERRGGERAPTGERTIDGGSADKAAAAAVRPMTAAQASVIGSIRRNRRPTMLYGVRLR